MIAMRIVTPCDQQRGRSAIDGDREDVIDRLIRDRSGDGYSGIGQTKEMDLRRFEAELGDCRQSFRFTQRLQSGGG